VVTERIVQNRIEEKLNMSFTPHHLAVINESHQHNVPIGAESHFKVVLVSDIFAGLRQIQRQQKVYQVLAEEMSGSVHALSMQTLSIAEWEADNRVTLSPPCMGGSQS
jgi:BolA family transcriptional regulator, general stress-responsive regulator